MRTAICVIAWAWIGSASAAVRCGHGLLRHVRPEMGTVNSYQMSHGNVYPLVGRPWGMHSFSPQTRPNDSKGWFYHYDDAEFRGLRLTHQLSPWIGDYACWSILPVTGRQVVQEGKDRFHAYSHADEKLSPASYSVGFAKSGIEMEFAPTMRAGVARIRYAEGDFPGLVVDPFAGGEVVYDSKAHLVTGKSVVDVIAPHDGVPPRNFFVLSFDREVLRSTRLSDGALHLVFRSDPGGTVVNARLASSFISGEQALVNLKEVRDRSVEEVVREGETEWNDMLKRVLVGEGREDLKEVFYTCLYRMLLFPKAHWEVDARGEIVHFSPADGETRAGYWYAGTCFWDTFRALFPFLNLVYPEKSAEMLSWLQNCWRECGWLPELSSPGLTDCMIGNNVVSVIADAWLSGVRGDFDILELYRAALHEVENAHPRLAAIGRAGVADYNARGYVVRGNTPESVSRTLEYAYDDWCLARLGESIGRPREETERYRERSRNWRNVFDPRRQIVVGRNADGSFNESFNPFAWGGDFTEGCAHHWTWCVFHDIPGLMEAMGGKKAFERRLDEIFTMPSTADWTSYGICIHEIREMQSIGFGQYAHGNQPIQHMIYLYNWTDSPWKAGLWARRVMERLYRPTPDGYCGDEDNGQTSAWFVWSALGLYPVCPGSERLGLGAPLFRHAELTLGNGGKLEVLGPGEDGYDGCRGDVLLNGRSVPGNAVPLPRFQAGGRIVFARRGPPK